MELFVLRFLLLLVLLLPKRKLVYVGTYTSQLYAIDPATMTSVASVDVGANPSSLALHRGVLYVANEENPGAIRSYVDLQLVRWSELPGQPAAVAAHEDTVAVALFTGGVALLSLDLGLRHIIPCGAAHDVAFWRNSLLYVDYGNNLLNGSLRLPGGPRSLYVDGDHALVSLQDSAGAAFVDLQRWTALIVPFDHRCGDVSAIAYRNGIVAACRRWKSNTDGRLVFVGNTTWSASTLGDTPRSFLLLDDHILVANQNTNTIRKFSLDPFKLQATLRVDSPAYLLAT